MPAFRLLALLAPGSVEAEVGKVQSAVFSAHGFLSAIALPPLIPVQPVSDALQPRHLEGLGKAAPHPVRVTTTGLSWEGGGLFLGLDSGGLWAALRRGAREAFPSMPDAPSPFEFHEGFCLGCWEASERKRTEIRPEAPVLRFSSCILALVSLLVPSEGGEWWREVYMEIVAKKPL